MQTIPSRLSDLYIVPVVYCASSCSSVYVLVLALCFYLTVPGVAGDHSPYNSNCYLGTVQSDRLGVRRALGLRA